VFPSTRLTSVLVPTYRRPQALARCLTALQKQSTAPSEVLIIVRESDAETWKLLSRLTSPLNIRLVTVKVGGVVAALNAGLDAAQGEIVAITDDDAAPQADWLSRIMSRFADGSKIGGVGGRDLIHRGDALEDGVTQVVGKVQWFGRVIGNHHLGIGPAREVATLKGANMSYRRTAITGIRFDERLRGDGAQVHYEMAMGLLVKRRGWTLMYDPEIVVDHYPAERFDNDRRDEFSPQAVSNAVYNETLILLEHLPPPRKQVFLLWSFLIGTRSAPGLGQLIRLFPSHPRMSMARFKAAMRGRWDGHRTWRANKVRRLSKIGEF
jgi:cellulose synthase/poly-beta-1,6-N-acetylglucosamine synthase-like glycosyltransferase